MSGLFGYNASFTAESFFPELVLLEGWLCMVGEEKTILFFLFCRTR